MVAVEASLMSNEHTLCLRQAVNQLEVPTMVDRMTAFVGKPAEMTMKALPIKYQHKLSSSVQRTIEWCFDWVLLTVDTSKQGTKSADMTHRFMAAGTGAVTGFIGGAALLVELPVTTGLLMRTIADIARSEGEDLSDPLARQACVEVLALDPTSVRGDHQGVSAYHMVRNQLANLVADASSFFVQSAAIEAMSTVSGQATAEVAATVASNVVQTRSVSPALVRLMNEIATRFGVTISERVAAGLIPVIGALGGAAVNAAFIQHFQRIAHGHFTVRRLERIYGPHLIANEYDRVWAEVQVKRL